MPPEGLKSHEVIQVQPSDGCAQLITPLEWTQGRIVVIDRGNCPFVQKVFYAQRAGATAAIIVDNIPVSVVALDTCQNLGQDRCHTASFANILSSEKRSIHDGQR